MNSRPTLFGAALALIALVTSESAPAKLSDGLGSWTGSGAAIDASGRELGAFTVALSRRLMGTGKIRSEGTVTLANGQRVPFWQEVEEKAPMIFHQVSNNGEGDGRCFANGMCQIYEQGSNGHAFATTTAPDGNGRVRILVTELESGTAVRFYQQTLMRKP